MTSSTSTQLPGRSRIGGLLDYRTVDLVTAAMFGVAFGVAYFGWDQAYTGVNALFSFYLPASGLLGGPWLMAGVVAGLVVRRPGAALLAELVAANVEYLVGGQWGASTMIAGLLQGAGAELVLAIFLYRRFNVWVAALSGIAAAIAEAVYEWAAYYADWSMTYKLLYAGLFAVSGALVAGLLGSLLVRALAVSGALDAFPAGHEHRDRHAI